MVNKKNIFLFGYGNFGRQLYKNLSVSGNHIKVISANENFIEQALLDDLSVIKINIKRNDDIETICMKPHQEEW